MSFTASIITRDFVNQSDKALKIGGAAYTRKISYNNNWSRIRVGALVSVTANGTNNINDVAFTLGLCSGLTYPASAPSPANAVGACFCGNLSVGAVRLFQYIAGTGNPYYSMTAGTAYRKQGLTVINSSSTVTSFFIPQAGTGLVRRRVPILIDITRNVGGGGLASITVYGIAVQASVFLDYRPDDLQYALDYLGTPILRGITMTAGTTVTLAVGEETGPLDTLELFWSSQAFPMEVYATGAVITAPTLNTGTQLPYPNTPGAAADDFTQYAAETQITSTGTSTGTGWSQGGTIVPFGYSNGTVVINLPGTSGGYPDESFQQYATGSVTSNVTINAGTGWTSNAFIY